MKKIKSSGLRTRKKKAGTPAPSINQQIEELNNQNNYLIERLAANNLAWKRKCGLTIIETPLKTYYTLYFNNQLN